MSQNSIIAKPPLATCVSLNMRILSFVVCLASSAMFGQAPTAPVVGPRGVVNADTQQPAPSSVSPGGVIWINGINLGPPEGWKADTVPLPTQVGEPPMEVRINNRPAPLFSLTPGRIVAQVPFETPMGQAQVVVRRGNQTSRPVRFNVVQPNASVRTTNGSGFGAAGVRTDTKLKLTATGLGQTDPPTESGALPLADNVASPRLPIRAMVGGIPAPVSANLSTERVGEFEISVELPASTLNGDVVHLYVGNSVGNRVTSGRQAEARMSFVRLPEGGAAVRGMTVSDLRPGFLALSAPRNEEGCWPSFLVDVLNQKAESLPGCYTAAAQQAPTPFVIANEGNALAALAGPPQGDAASGLSSKLALFTPTSEPRELELPDRASILNPAPNGNLNVVLPGPPARAILVNTLTGELGDPVTVGAPGGGAVGGGQGGINLNTLQVDLGDDVKTLVVAPVNIGQNLFAIVAVDSVSAPTKAKFAVINPQGVAQINVAFPDGWLPLIAPQQAPGPGGGGVVPGVPGGQPGGAAGPAANLRGLGFFDGPTRMYYLLARRADDSRDSFLRFPVAPNQEPEALPLPENLFIVSCSPQLRLFNLDLVRRLAVAVTNVAESTVKNPCAATGFLTFDLASRELAPVALPGSGQFNATGNSVNEVNDYVYGTNTDPARQGRSDTLYVFDGVTNSTFRLDLPPEIATFAAPQPFPLMGLLFAQATARVAGDAGIVVFDLENASSKLLPTPAGFAAVVPLGILPVTRKLIARGTKTEPLSTQILIYDLDSGDLTIVENPPGVAFAGQVIQPAAPGGGGVPGGGGAGGGQQAVPVLQNLNTKSNAVTVVGFNANRQPAGVMLIRVH